MATLQTTATRPGGDSHADGKAYFETSTNQLIVWDAAAGEWIQLDSDGTGAAPVEVNVFGSRADITSNTSYDSGTLALAEDTGDLLIYDGSVWNVYNADIN